MIKNIYILFKIGRVLSKSNQYTLTYFDKIYKIPFFLKIFIKILGFSISKPKYTNDVPVGERLSSALKE